MVSELYQSGAKRDERAKELRAEGYQVKRRVH